MLKNFLLLIILLPLSQQQDPRRLLDAVNSERGGRHWIDQKPDPSKTPEKSQACFQIEPGSRIELVAAEPLVLDPVWIDFDHRGRMFVAEYSDYPIGPVKADGTEDPVAAAMSKIVMLEDIDGDGRMDKRTVFADHLKFCHSFMPLMGGILAGAQTEIVFLKDTDGDNVADVREVWFDGFAPAHPQMQIGCPQWGMDNWIYLTYAPGNVRCRRPGFETADPVALPRQDMRFDPVTMKFETVSGMGQFGNTVDNDGNRFFSTNRNPIMMEMISESVGKRNPFAIISPRHVDVGPSCGDTKVFPLVNMKSNWLAHAGTHTSACGVTAYRGDLWDTSFQHSVFVCEPVGHLVTRSIVASQTNSAALTATRARPDADFLASNDTWFRPASLRTGPEGALYLADMYRMWVEHPKFLPPEIAAQIDWRAGDDKGRIWRIVPETTAKTIQPYVSSDDLQQITNMLRDTNGWRRQTAQRQLIERLSVRVNDTTAIGDEKVSQAERESTIDSLRKLLLPDESAITKHHVLHTLQGIGSLSDNDLLIGFGDADPGVRKAAAVLAMLSPSSNADLRNAAAKLIDDTDPPVKFAALQNLANVPSETLSQSSELVRSEIWADTWFKNAAMSIANERALWLIEILKQRSSVKSVHELTSGTLLAELATAIAAKGDESEVAALLNMSAAAETTEVDVSAIVLGFEKGAKRNQGPLPYRSLSSLLEAPPVEMQNDAVATQKRILKVVSVVSDPASPVSVRAAAMRLLAVVKRGDFIEEIPNLLAADQSQLIQQATISIIREFGIAEAMPVVLSGLQTLTPDARKDAASLLLLRPESTIELLTRMRAGQIAPAIVDIDQRLRLLQDRNETVRLLAAEVFGGVVSANRKEVADKYQPAISLAASRDRGAIVFEKTCSKCHKVNGKGHNVGPDISDTRNRSRDALLYDILDPNRRVDPQFSEYVVVTTDGRTFNGLLMSDSGDQIVLRQAEGKVQTVDRADIDELQATNKSLMPEGIEKDVSVEQMADLLEFLKAR